MIINGRQTKAKRYEIKFSNLEELLYYFKYCNVCEVNCCEIDIYQLGNLSVPGSKKLKYKIKDNKLHLSWGFFKRKIQINLQNSKFISGLFPVDYWHYLKIHSVCPNCNSQKISNPIIVKIYNEMCELFLTRQKSNYMIYDIDYTGEYLFANDIEIDSNFDWFKEQFNKKSFLNKIKIIQTFQ